MKKITKGAIAAGAASVLLMGGAGTFMSWNQDNGVTAAPINSGLLTLESDPSKSSWKLNDNDVPDISTVRIVPTDILTFTQPVEIVAEGDNVQGELSLDAGSIEATSESGPGGVALATALTEGATYSFVDATEGLSQVDATNFTFDSANTYTADLTVKLNFGEDSVTGLVAQGGAVQLDKMIVKLAQVPETPAE